MHKPACLGDVQKFIGCLVSLSRFVNRLGERALPLYQLIKKTTEFEWMPQADVAFRDLKRMLSTAPILATLAKKEPLLMYIAATSRVVSVVLVVEHQVLPHLLVVASVEWEHLQKFQHLKNLWQLVMLRKMQLIITLLII